MNILIGPYGGYGGVAQHIENIAVKFEKFLNEVLES